MRAPSRRVARRLQDERGAVIVIVALMMVALLTMVTIVVDLGNMRSHRRSLQSVVDFAALAGGEHLVNGNGPAACEQAMDYLRLNAPDVSEDASVPCEKLPVLVTPCSGYSGTSETVTDEDSAAPFRISVTYPVLNPSIHDARFPFGLRPDDGTPCERIRVHVERTTQGYFSGIIGVDTFDISADAVARRLPEQLRRIPNLWLLDPWGCNALTVSGNSYLEVGTDAIGGLITVDSAGVPTSVHPEGCSGNSYTIDAGGSGLRILVKSPTTTPRGAISLVAMDPGQTFCGEAGGNPFACNPADIPTQIQPQPESRSEPATRAIVDRIFNCLPSYPNYHGLPLEGCDASDTRPPYISELRDVMTGSTPPTGFEAWPYGCDNPAPPPDALTKNWWIDCGTNGTFKLDSVSLEFRAGNIVLNGDIQLSGDAKIFFNCTAAADPADPCVPVNPQDTLPTDCLDKIRGLDCYTQSAKNAAFVYLRNGDIKSSAQAQLNAHNTAVIQDGGILELTGQSPPRWTAPDEGPFNQLALWSEKSSNQYSINGGANMLLEGIFFTPEANPFSLSGGGSLVPQLAQFVSYHLALSGGAQLVLTPSGAEVLREPPPAAILIR